MTDDFRTQYGPWAVVAGASEGTGRAFAEQLAARGLSLVLLARRQAPLDALAADLRERYGVDCVTASIDLAAPDALAHIVASVEDREVGLYVSNAGSDPYNARFLDQDVGDWTALVTRNCLSTMQACHHFGRAMRERGRGGLLLVNSYACYGGASHLAAYAGSKAFELCFAESLWSELNDRGVHVLTLVMGMTDTPEFQRLMTSIGMPLPPGTAKSDDVAAFGIANLANGPIQNWGLRDGEAGPAPQSAADRRARILAIDEMKRSAFGG